MKALFLPQTSDLSPAAKFRIYQYKPYLEKEGLEVSILPGIKPNWHNKVYIQTNTLKKIYYYSRSLSYRLRHIPSFSHYDCIMLQKETFPKMYPFFEQLIALKYNNLAFDFDDAVFLKQTFKNFFPKILKSSAQVIAGNKFLYDFAIQYNNNTSIIPTTIDTDTYTSQKKTFTKALTIGWSGSITTNRYLNILNKPLSALFRKYTKLKLLIISNSLANISLDIPPKQIEFIPWNQEHEIDNLRKIDIGLMPLENDPWSQGKCGLKALQYMSLGIPSLCSPVGVNSEIIADGSNGFLAQTDADWFSKLEALLNNELLFLTMGSKARQTVEEKYSTKKWLPKLIEILKKTAKKPKSIA